MTTERVSQYWVMVLSRYIIELVPESEQDKHWAGDECWCNPNRLTLQHNTSVQRRMGVWVHDAKSEAALHDIQLAVRGTLVYWDGIYHI